jgi:hypothetical protein
MDTSLARRKFGKTGARWRSTRPVSAGLGGKAGLGPSFTWKASSAIAREDFSSASIRIIRPPSPTAQQYVGHARGKTNCPRSQPAASILAMHSDPTATAAPPGGIPAWTDRTKSQGRAPRRGAGLGDRGRRFQSFRSDHFSQRFQYSSDVVVDSRPPVNPVGLLIGSGRLEPNPCVHFCTCAGTIPALQRR